MIAAWYKTYIRRWRRNKEKKVSCIRFVDSTLLILTKGTIPWLGQGTSSRHKTLRGSDIGTCMSVECLGNSSEEDKRGWGLRLAAGLSSAPEGRNLLCLPNAEHGALQSYNFQLNHFFFLLCSRAISAGWRPISVPPFFLLWYFYSTQHTTTLRPCHRCLPPLRQCRHHPLPSAPLAAYCIAIAVIGPPPLPSPSLNHHRAAAAPPAPPPPLHRNVALDVNNLANSPQHGLLPVVCRMGFVGSVLHNHEWDWRWSRQFADNFPSAFWGESPPKKISFDIHGWIGSSMLACWNIQTSSKRDFGCLGICLMI